MDVDLVEDILKSSELVLRNEMVVFQVNSTIKWTMLKNDITNQ
jgi:hypothetical protein